MSITIGWLLKQSLILDAKFLCVSNWSYARKLSFLLQKYFLLAKHFFRKFEFGKDYALIDGKRIYYDSKYGLAGYQSILARHQKLIGIANIREAKVVVDVGANVGFFSKLIRDLYPKCRIYSIEPIPEIYSCMKRNFLNDFLTKTFNMAITDSQGEVSMSFDANDSAVSRIQHNGAKKVKANTLDALISEEGLRKIDLLKIDTETFEAHVLRGASATLALTKFLFIEITIKDNTNYSISSLMKLLSTDSYDYQLVAFRNYADVGEGKMPVMDALLVNLST